MYDPDWRTKHAGFISYVWQTENALVFTYVYDNHSCYVIYDIETKQTESWRIKCDGAALKCWCFDGRNLYILGDTDKETVLYKVCSI